MSNNSPDEQAVSDAQAHAFLGKALLSPFALSKLRLHQEGFVAALASRLSLLLRLDFSAKLSNLQTLPYKNWIQTWKKPSCLSLFKMDPLRGVSVLQMPPRLGASMVDRLMGGPGKAAEDVQEISEIERALLEQAVQIILSEWCRHWTKIKELKPVLLGYESDGEFIQIAPDTTMLVLAIDVVMGDCREQIQVGFPHAGVEGLVQQLGHDAEIVSESETPPASISAPQWKTCFDNVPIPVKAEWQVLELPVREVANLKVGDVIQVDARSSSQEVRVSLGDKVKFHAQLGTVNNHWAIELTEAVRS